jgi:hypothetical protein
MGTEINGDRPHFLYENVLFLTKWGLSPFIPKKTDESNSYR